MRPATVRRLAAPVWLALALFALALSPVMAAFARLMRTAGGPREPLALARLLCVYVVGELALLARAARLSRSDREGHYTLMRVLIDDLVGAAMHGFGLRLRVEAEPPALAALEADSPVLVFSRHAGPGDSLLLIHLLLSRFDRRPRVVLKDVIGIDPAVGLLGRRLPNALLTRDADGAADAVRDLAAGLDRRAALLLFPEGGNFTEPRRARAIEWLRRRGHGLRADRAERLEHMLSPRPGGALAAMAGAPDADVVFTAHTGLGRAAKGLQLLRELPQDDTVHFRLWLAPAAERPSDEAGQVEWLDAWWARLDAWVDAQGETGVARRSAR